MALQTKYPSPLASYYSYGMSNYGLSAAGIDAKIPYFGFGQSDSIQSAINYNSESINQPLGF